MIEKTHSQKRKKIITCQIEGENENTLVHLPNSSVDIDFVKVYVHSLYFLDACLLLLVSAYHNTISKICQELMETFSCPGMSNEIWLYLCTH